MKKIIGFSIFLFASVALVSCEDILKEKTYEKVSSDEFLTNEDNVIAVVGQAYAEVKWLHDHWGYWGINTLSSDECMNPIRDPKGDWNDDGYWRGFNSQSWTPDDLSFEYVWQYSNAGAVLCNKILLQLENARHVMSPDLYNRFVAELKVLRCYYHYTLFDAFGRIPLLENYSSENVPQSETWEVWNRLVTILAEEAERLPNADNPNKDANYGRCSRGMAYALLARLYLNAESFGVTPGNCGIKEITTSADFYNRCVAACDSVIKSGTYKIEPDFFANFKIHNEKSEENIFVIVENGNASFDYRDVAGKMANKLRITLLTLHYRHKEAWGLLEEPWSGFCAPKSFLDKYEYQVDLRGPCDSLKGTDACDGWGWFLGPIKDANGNIYKNDATRGNSDAIITSYMKVPDTGHPFDHATPNDGARLLKYEVDKGGENKYCENDFVLFRYADVLYMKAEALLRGATSGNLTELLAMPDFQLMRTRVNQTPYTEGTLTLDELLDERGREFAWEMVRRRDLIRYNRFSQGTWDYKQVVDKHFDWFPIPRKMIETSGGLWTQNPGYTTKQ